MSDIHINDNKKKLPVIRYIIYLLLVTSIVTGVSLSRYITTLTGTDKARVAEFSYEITGPLEQEKEGVYESYVPIYATSKLTEADKCMFDDVAVVREVVVINNSEVAVHAGISNIYDMTTAKGIVWCIFDEDDSFDPDASTTAIETAIKEKLTDSGYATVPSGYNDLVNALINTNQKTIDAWNSKADIGFSPNNTRTLTAVFWAEHDGIMANWVDDTDLNDFFTDFTLTFNVIQID